MADELLSGGPGAGEMPAGSDAASSPAPADVTSTSAHESPVASAASADGADADDLDADDEDYSDLPQDHPKVQKLLKRLRKVDNWAKRHRPIVQRVRDLNVDDLIVAQRNHQSLVERLNAEPELWQRLAAPPGRPAEQARQAPAQRPQYTPPAIPPPPFTADDEAGQYMHGLHQMAMSLHQQIFELKQHYGHGLKDVLEWRKSIETTNQRQKSQQRVQSWKAAIAEHGKDYDEDGQALLEREVTGLFEYAQKNNLQHVLDDPKTFIPKMLEKYGKPLQRFRKQQQQAAAALVQQASAAAATRGARPAAFTGGIPAGARSPKRETVKDVTRRLLRGA